MKTEIKKKIQQIIDSYNTAKRDIVEKIEQWKNDTIYSDEYKNEKIKELEADAASYDALFNNKVKEVIAEEKKAIIGEPESKPADYQVQISNALKFIELAGDKLTDEQAFELVKPFLGDHQTMKYFYAALSRMNGLYVTSSILGAFEKIEKKFDLFHNTYKNFFNNGTYTTNSLLAVMRESAIINDIEPIEELIQRFDDVIPASYEEAKDEIENNIQDKMGV